MSHWHLSQGDNTHLTSSTGESLSRLPRCAVVKFRRDDGHITTKPWVCIETAGIAAKIDRKLDNANFMLEEFSFRDLGLLEKPDGNANLNNVQVSAITSEAERKTRRSKIPHSGKSWMLRRHSSMKHLVAVEALRKYAAIPSRAQPGTACDLNYSCSEDSSPWYSRASLDSAPSSLTGPSVDEYRLEQKGEKMRQKRGDRPANLPGSRLKHFAGLFSKACAASTVLYTKRPTTAEVEIQYAALQC